ncbi:MULTISPECIES: hypothetical protein [Sphingomonas]|jgi:hypothetical protein|uniref:hypothetical protein n=1 Tax=Sphingomonas TaxID=13687 RepID=UPI00193C77ED|nr:MULTISPECIES: hypothetical protein [Sphingomonas]
MLIEMAGALAGWRRNRTRGGTVLTLQIADSAEGFRQGSYTKLHLALNDRQLRSLARDLYRATDEKGITLFAPRRWWKPWSRKLPD